MSPALVQAHTKLARAADLSYGPQPFERECHGVEFLPHSTKDSPLR